MSAIDEALVAVSEHIGRCTAWSQCRTCSALGGVAIQLGATHQEVAEARLAGHVIARLVPVPMDAFAFEDED